MPVFVIDTLKPKNGLDFPVVEAVDVAVEGYSSLADAVTHFATDTAIAAINAVLSGKANTSDVNTAVANLQGQIDQIVISASAEAVVAPEVAAARVGDDGTEYTTLKARLDAENSILNENIDKIAKFSPNIYDASKDKQGSISNTDGTITDSTDRKYSEKIYLESGKSVTISTITTSDLTRGAVKIAFYGENDTFLRIAVYGTTTQESVTVAITNEKYIRLVSLVDTPPYMVNYGDTLLPYEPYGAEYNENIDNQIAIETMTDYVDEIKEELDSADEEINSRIDELYIVSDNMYNPDTDTLGKGMSDDGTITDNNARKISDFIAVEPLTSISVKSCSEYASADGVMFVALYNNSKQFIRRQGITATGSGVRVDIDNNAYNIRLVLNIDAVDIMVNAGATLLPYAPYGTVYNVNIDAIKAKNEAIAASKAYTDSVITAPTYKFVPLNVTENYEPNSPKSIADDDVDTDFKVSTITSQQIYDALDALMETYPQYISRKLLGKDQTNTFNIYEYDLIPEQPEITPSTAEWFDLPTLLICSGIHGNGDTASDAGDKPVNVCALYYFIKDLCENWRNNETLAYLRFNLNIKIIPIVNPWGFDNKHRYNGNYVDLNRNFDYNWAAGSYGDYTYGTSAFSEAETQIVRDFVNANLDAIGFFDFHCTGGSQEQSRLVYCSMHKDSDMIIPINGLIKQMSLTWDKRDYDGLTAMNFHGYVTTNTAPTMASWVYGADEITACNTEVFPNFINSNIKTMGADIMYMATEEIGNAVMSVVRYKSTVR